MHVDLATGGGTIALAVADEVPKAAVYGTDLSKDAIKLARKNAKRLGSLGARSSSAICSARSRSGSAAMWTSSRCTRRTSRATRWTTLPDEIREWEPEHTLTDRSADGLGLIRRAIEESPAWLRPGGWLLMEVDPDRAREVMPVYRRRGFRDVRSTKGGPLQVTRVIVGRRP